MGRADRAPGADVGEAGGVGNHGERIADGAAWCSWRSFGRGADRAPGADVGWGGGVGNHGEHRGHGGLHGGRIAGGAAWCSLRSLGMGVGLEAATQRARRRRLRESLREAQRSVKRSAPWFKARSEPSDHPASRPSSRCRRRRSAPGVGVPWFPSVRGVAVWAPVNARLVPGTRPVVEIGPQRMPISTTSWGWRAPVRHTENQKAPEIIVAPSGNPL